MALQRSIRSRSRGLALPVALLLLAVLLLLAAAAIRSSSFGFIMAGNEQFRENAFVASETGIEKAMGLGNFNPQNSTVTLQGPVSGTADQYAVSIVTQLQGVPQGVVFGTSWNAFSTYHFEIQSTGTSARSASASHVQGVAVIAPNAVIITGPGGP
jgi:hypothetical protein